MKIKINMKNPDCVYDAIREAAEESAAKVNGISAREKVELTDARERELSKLLSKWITYGEYIEVEFDTDAGTARVCEAR